MTHHIVVHHVHDHHNGRPHSYPVTRSATRPLASCVETCDRPHVDPVVGALAVVGGLVVLGAILHARRRRW